MHSPFLGYSVGIFQLYQVRPIWNPSSEKDLKLLMRKGESEPKPSLDYQGGNVPRSIVLWGRLDVPPDPAIQALQVSLSWGPIAVLEHEVKSQYLESPRQGVGSAVVKMGIPRGQSGSPAFSPIRWITVSIKGAWWICALHWCSWSFQLHCFWFSFFKCGYFKGFTFISWGIPRRRLS